MIHAPFLRNSFLVKLHNKKTLRNAWTRMLRADGIRMPGRKEPNSFVDWCYWIPCVPLVILVGGDIDWDIESVHELPCWLERVTAQQPLFYTTATTYCIRFFGKQTCGLYPDGTTTRYRSVPLCYSFLWFHLGDRRPPAVCSFWVCSRWVCSRWVCFDAIRLLCVPLKV